MVDKKVKIKARRSVVLLFWLVLFILILFIYARYINTHGFVVNEIAIIDKSLDDSYNGFKIVHFSDIHFGRTIFEEDLKNIVDEINLLKPDVIVFTGDLFDDKNIVEKNEDLVMKYFKKLEARLFKFAIIGDYDKKYLDSYEKILDNSDFILLDNNFKLVYDDCSYPINFVGLSDTKIDNLDNNNYFTITLLHQPDLVKNVSNSNIILAGHSLGGQIKIPFLGGIIKKDGANNYINEYYNVDKQKLYISNGLGTENFSFRLFNKPSINLYRLYNY